MQEKEVEIKHETDKVMVALYKVATRSQIGDMYGLILVKKLLVRITMKQ